MALLHADTTAATTANANATITTTIATITTIILTRKIIIVQMNYVEQQRQQQQSQVLFKTVIEYHENFQQNPFLLIYTFISLIPFLLFNKLILTL